MRRDSASAFWQHGARTARKAVPMRRLLSVAELCETLARDVAVRSPVHGAAWRDVRLVFLSFHGSGATRLPPAAVYSVLSTGGYMAVGSPGSAMELRWTQPHEATMLCIEPRLLAAAAHECGLGDAPPELGSGAAPYDPVCERLLGALTEEANAAPYAPQELIVESIANAVAYRLVTRLRDSDAHTAAARGALNPRAFRDVSSYIEQHIDERLSLDELARVAGVSRFHFARQFRLRTGESPMGFLLRARIERGKSLLRDGAASIGGVAAALGFADQSHFTRTFKRLVGMPPSAYKSGAQTRNAARGGRRAAPATAAGVAPR